jgi:hypothetical protein
MIRFTAGRSVVLVAAGAIALSASACGNTSAGSPSPTASSSPSPTSTVPTEAVIGMTVEQATTWAADHHYTVRVVEIDGQGQPVTMDYRTDRINLVINNGVVASAKIS